MSGRTNSSPEKVTSPEREDGTAAADLDLLTRLCVVAFVGMAGDWDPGEIGRGPDVLIAFADALRQERMCGAADAWILYIK